jgi:hypothetical protein
MTRLLIRPGQPPRRLRRCRQHAWEYGGERDRPGTARCCARCGLIQEWVPVTPRRRWGYWKVLA